MKATVTRKDLAKAVRLAVAATEAKASIPVLASALLVASDDRITIAGTNLMVGASVSVACKVEKPGRATADAGARCVERRGHRNTRTTRPVFDARLRRGRASRGRRFDRLRTFFDDDRRRTRSRGFDHGRGGRRS